MRGKKKIESMKRLETIEEYNIEVMEGEIPLIDPSFDLEINLRKKVQDSLFGEEDNMDNRNKFFLWVWEHKPHVCEETGTYLGFKMQAIFMSHILTRGAHIEMWNDPRNINILSPDSHRRWETGKRESMRIYKKNCETISILKAEYAKLKRYKVFEDKNKKEKKESAKKRLYASKIYRAGEMADAGRYTFAEWWEREGKNIDYDTL